MSEDFNQVTINIKSSTPAADPHRPPTVNTPDMTAKANNFKINWLKGVWSKAFNIFKLVIFFIVKYKSNLAYILLAFIIFSGGVFSTYLYFNRKNALEQIVLPAETAKTVQPNIHSSFLMEIYDKIKENYWKKINDEELVNLYKLATEKVTEGPQHLENNDRQSLETNINAILENKTKEQQKDFAVKLATVVLANLEPFGRSGLYTAKEETALKNLVQNIDPNTNLYEVLDVTKEARPEEITKNYQQKSNELEAIINDKNRPETEKEEAKNKLTLIERAHDTLASEPTKNNYDQAGVEAAVIGRLVRPDIFYIRFKKFSPTSYNEFVGVAQSMDSNTSENLNTLIFDLRGNIGGSIDLLQYFLGPFIGQNNTAFEFFHQDNYAPYKTVTGWLPSLVRYKKVVILVDGNTQSSAEMMAATMKKYNVGVLVGAKTKGWGTVEMVYNLDNQIAPGEEKYSMFLVNSITLRDDNQPIEGRGVEPTIDITNSNWQKEFYAYYHWEELGKAVEEVLTNP